MVQAGQVAGQGGPLRRGPRRPGQLDHRLDGCRRVGREVAGQRLLDHPRPGGRRQGAGVRAAPGDGAERRAEREQDHHDHGDVGDRSAHDAAGDAVPGAAGLVGGRPAHALPAAGAADAQRVDPVAEHREQRGHDGQRGQHVHHDRGHAAVAHGAQEHLGEQHQAGQRDRDGDARHGDGAAGRGHGPGQRFLHRGPGAQFLPEPGGHEQPVVDGQAQAEDCGDVDGVDRHVGDQGQQAQRGERAEDADRADRQRQAGGGQAAEDHQQQDQQHRHGDPLGPADVGLDLIVDRQLGRDLPAHVGGQARDAELAADGLVGLHLGAVVAAGQPEHRVGLVAAVPGEQRRPGGPVRLVGEDLVLRQGGQAPGHRGPVGRVPHGQGRAAVQHHHVGRVAAERARGQRARPLALAARGGEAPARLQRAEHTRSPHRRAGHDQRRHQQDQPPATVYETSPCLEHRPLRGYTVTRCLPL